VHCELAPVLEGDPPFPGGVGESVVRDDDSAGALGCHVISDRIVRESLEKRVDPII
jgi:hypothetical protein